MVVAAGIGGGWRRGASSPRLFCYLLLVVALPRPPSALAQRDGYGCGADGAAYPCRAYAFYRAAAPDLLDLAAIGDLFSVSRLMITNASGIPAALASSPLAPGQPLLIPLTCSCTAGAGGSNRSYALLPYQIKAGDTFYRVSTFALQNLTTWQEVEMANPSLVATKLPIGAVAVFPVFCRCPQRVAGSSFVTYVAQISDTPSSVASLFGADPRSLLAPNGTSAAGAAKLEPFAAVLVPVSRLPVLHILPQQQQQPPPPLPPRSPAAEGGRSGAVVGLGAGMGVMGAMLLAALWWGWKKEGARGGREKGKQMVRLESRSGGDLMAEIVECLDRYRVFEVEELRRATSGFADECRLGQSVYRGCLDDGATYAVKKLHWNASQELKILQKVNHTNLVKLEGFSIDPEDATSYLVYEFIENGSLRSWLHNDRNNTKLDWRTRLSIALDVASGLQYIHEHTSPKVVHKDIKASNILLDGNMRAKIANFGLTRSGSNAITTMFVGTHGYIAPEYIADGLVSTKMDVFAYGVILLELVSGKEAVSKDGKALWMELEIAFEEEEEKRNEELRKWADDGLVKQRCPMDSIINVLAIARSCLQIDPSKRPSMVDVAYNLSRFDDLFIDYSGDGLPVSNTVVAR